MLSVEPSVNSTVASLSPPKVRPAPSSGWNPAEADCALAPVAARASAASAIIFFIIETFSRLVCRGVGTACLVASARPPAGSVSRLREPNGELCCARGACATYAAARRGRRATPRRRACLRREVSGRHRHPEADVELVPEPDHADHEAEFRDLGLAELRLQRRVVGVRRIAIRNRVDHFGPGQRGALALAEIRRLSPADERVELARCDVLLDQV